MPNKKPRPPHRPENATGLPEMLALEARSNEQGPGFTEQQMKYTSRLPLSAIKLAPQVYQPRLRGGLEGHSFDQHVQQLRQALKDDDTKRAGFEPLDVFPIAGEWFLIDGHARHAAYTQDGYSRPVRVKVFRGNFRESLHFSREANKELKLCWSPKERKQAAWDLVIFRDSHSPESTEKRSSIRDICSATGLSVALVHEMASYLQKGLQGHSREALRCLTWAQMEMLRRGISLKDISEEERIERFADQLSRAFTKQLRSHQNAPSSFGRAIPIGLGEDVAEAVVRTLTAPSVVHEDNSDF